MTDPFAKAVEPGSGRWGLTGYDVAGLVAGGVAAVWGAAHQVWLGPWVLAGFHDESWPMTRWSQSPQMTTLLVVLAVTAGSGGLLTNASRRTRLVLMATAILFAIILLLSFVASVLVVGVFAWRA